MSFNKVLVLIQARMGSTRFPKKMMAELHGMPMIEWVLRRCGSANQIDQVVLATSDLQRDDVLADHAEICGFDVYRGNEADVLGRFAKAAEQYNADIIVRVCGDRPLVAAEAIDAAVTFFDKNDVDLAFNHIPEGGQNWPMGFGCEVLSAQLLFEMSNNQQDEYYREHVTSYMWKHSENFKLIPTPFDFDICHSNILRFDVDTKQDLALLNQMSGLTINSSIQDILDVYFAQIN